jgi:hypothetical protein
MTLEAPEGRRGAGEKRRKKEVEVRGNMHVG